MPRGVKGARGPRNSVRDRPAAWRLLVRRQHWLLRPALALGAIGLVLLGLTALLRSGAPGSLLDRVHLALAKEAARGGLVVRHIRIEGRNNTPPAILREAMDIHHGTPILAVPIRAVAGRIDRLSWVQAATVERRLPDTIVIRLTERRPFAIWQDHGTFRVIDRDGNVVTDRHVTDFRRLPLVVGPGAPPEAARLIDALNAQPELMSRVAASVRVGGRRWDLDMKSGMTVRLPGGHAVRAIARLAQLEAQFALLDRRIRIVDLRLPSMLVLRPVATDATPPKAGKKPT